jgi:hypothetical protein
MRRPGRAISVTSPELVDTEKSVAVAGETTADFLEFVDDSLKRLAAVVLEKTASLPDVAAVEVTPTVVALHLREAISLPPVPWFASDDGLVWIINRPAGADTLGLSHADSPSPWPLLVTVGHDDAGHVWLLNVEDQNITVRGDSVATADFARFIAAEIACNPWSRDTNLDLFGIASEIVAMRPDRIRLHDAPALAAANAVADAVRNVDRLADPDVDTTTARARQDDPDPWPSRMLLTDRRHESDELAQLRGLVQAHRGRTGTSVVTLGGDEPGLQLLVDEQRHLRIPAVNLTLTAVGLTSAEAHGCAALLAQADDDTDMPVPDLQGGQPWQRMATTSGSLRDQFVVPRDVATVEPSASMLGRADDDYINAAATTVEDLEVLSPRVTESVRDRVLEADPTLEADVAEWFSDAGPRPRLTLLGPVRARVKSGVIDRRKAFYTELFAYLATRPFGATTDEVAAAFDITPARVRIDVNKLRGWLGTNPATGAKYVPDARDSPAARHRGVGVYEVVDALVDTDLFRRLHLRAESTGPQGIAELHRALQLVEGRPFQSLRPSGWSWLLQGDRLDHHMTSAIVDVAHIVATDALERADLDVANWAAGVAVNAAPDEEVPRLDLAAVLEAQGQASEAANLLRSEVCNRDETGDGPTDLCDRTDAVLAKHHWLRRNVM